MPLKKSIALAAFGLPTLGVLAYKGAFSSLFGMHYLPHRYCYLAQPWLIWSNVTMDALIAASYVVIFSCLFWIAGRLRRFPEVHAFLWVFIAFGLFIVACASTHLMEVVTVWWPLYRLSVAFKVLCAASSVATAILFAKAAPELTRGVHQLLNALSTTQQAYASGLVEREQVQGQFRSSQAQLQAILDNVLDSIIMIDAAGTMVSTNAAVVKMFAYQTEELVGKNLKMLMPEPNRSDHDGHLARYQSTGMTKAIGVGRELEGLTGSGRVFPMELTITELSLEGKRMFVGLIRDISERKQTEERLALQGEQLNQSRRAMEDQSFMLQSVLDSMVEGLVAANEQGKFILWNPAAEKLIGLGAADLTPSEWSDHYGVFFPDKVTPIPPGQTPLERAIRGEVVHCEVLLRNPQLEREVWLEINSSPLRGKDGVLRGGVAAFRDISQRKADELEIRELNNNLEDRIAKRTEQLEAANRELEAFSYSVSHDLRTPLRHISGFARILVNDFGAEMTGEAREHLQHIEDAVLRMGLLVDGLLSMAILRRRPLRLSPTELNRLIAEVISVLAPECEGREVEWRIGRLPVLDCDPVLMSQVFQNLLSNALKYSSGRSPAVIEVDTIQEPGQPVIVLVRDNGAGFDMRYARKLFGMFQRLHTASEFAGTGVGLATVHRIIQKHGGLIWAEAEPDHGATFYFSLQVAEPAEVTAKAAAFPLTWPNGLA
jgi:PAS domain S-box-containing protein